MMGTGRGSSNQNPNVFTEAQREELEQQALIYKYMVSGVPVPTHLILSVRRSLYNYSSSSSSSLLSNHHQPTLGGLWEGVSSFPYNHLNQIGGYGYGSTKLDLEPGRCRRTDGKKWRCSKEAYPDSKYCERHMHRGRNRSRKPVEFSSSSSSSSANVSSSPSTTISKPIDAHPSSSSSYSHHTLKDYRHLQGMKCLGEDERSSAYFQLTDHPYTTSITHKMSSDHHNYSHHFNFHNLKDEQKKEEETHCFVMGTDFIKPTTKPSDTKVDTTTTTQPFHHFFSPPKTTLNNPNHNHDETNWVEVDHHHHPKAPLSTQDLFQSKPRPYW